MDQSLWDELRNRRRKIAEAQGVPPYVIFHDASLMEMLERRPQTLDEFATITGVGEKKLDRYGAEFLELLQQPA